MGKKSTTLRTLLGLLCLLAFAFTLSGCTAAQGNERTITAGVRSAIVNFGYLNEQTGRYYGLEIDIAQALATELGYTNVEFVTAQPKDREALLESEQVDFIIACYSITPERQELFDFTAPYYEDGLRVMAQKSACFTRLKDMAGSTLGVLTGTNSALVAATRMNELGLLNGFDPETFDPATFQGGVRFVQADSYDGLSTMLERGLVDAVVMDTSISMGYMNDDRMYIDEVLSPQSYGVATKKGSELSARMAQAMQTLINNGTIAQLSDKWD